MISKTLLALVLGSSLFAVGCAQMPENEASPDEQVSDELRKKAEPAAPAEPQEGPGLAFAEHAYTCKCTNFETGKATTSTISFSDSEVPKGSTAGEYADAKCQGNVVTDKEGNILNVCDLQ